MDVKNQTKQTNKPAYAYQTKETINTAFFGGGGGGGGLKKNVGVVCLLSQDSLRTLNFTLTPLPEISPWTGRFYSLLDPSYAKNNIPIIASVSEHQPTTWSSFYFDLQLLVFMFPGKDFSGLDKNIRFFHECEGRIEESAPRIIVWHHEACRVMTNGDPGGRIFLSYSHTNNGFFFLLTLK